MNEVRSWLFEKVNKIVKPPAHLLGEKVKAQIQHFRE